MPRETTNWKCDGCGLQTQGEYKPPEGWVETSFWTGVHFVRNAFCSYACLAQWASQRYDKQPKFVREEVNQ